TEAPRPTSQLPTAGATPRRPTPPTGATPSRPTSSATGVSGDGGRPASAGVLARFLRRGRAVEGRPLARHTRHAEDRAPRSADTRQAGRGVARAQATAPCACDRTSPAHPSATPTPLVLTTTRSPLLPAATPRPTVGVPVRLTVPR